MVINNNNNPCTFYKYDPGGLKHIIYFVLKKDL